MSRTRLLLCADGVLRTEKDATRWFKARSDDMVAAHLLAMQLLTLLWGSQQPVELFDKSGNVVDVLPETWTPSGAPLFGWVR